MRILAMVLLTGIPLLAQTEPDWVKRSNQNSQLLIQLTAKYAPEAAARMGIPGLDEQITVRSIDRGERYRKDAADIRTELQKRLDAERDPLVKQDLEILIAATDRSIHSSSAYEHALLPYDNVAETVFGGLHALLDDQIAAERRPAAVIRLRKYTGVEPGYKPVTLLAEQIYEERLQKNPSLLAPAKVEVEKDLSDTNQYVTGIGLLLEKYKMKGYEDAYAKLKDQLAQYDEFVRTKVLPRARTDFRLPPDLYAINLENVGVDYPIDQLVSMAHQQFGDIQNQMQQVAARVAKERGWNSSDYRDVIRRLKLEQLTGDTILPHYQKRLAEIEDIIRANHLVTLPTRPAIIRLATAAETAQQPAPHMVPPRLINNHGERGEFVLPLETKGQGGKTLKYDDFTFSAASWTLTAHEARPGHELQFDAMVERGVSLARALYAFNSTNVEGWGLYSEWFMLPYMPDDGKLISLQLRLLRAARAFLDPELQQGKVTPAQATDTLEKDVVLSPAFANEEVERFTFRMPGQAVSYFDGYNRLLEIRHAAEKALGSHFVVQAFHDFILSQGLLPPNLLRKAVMDDFVPAQNKTVASGG
ncbi:MAG TPA: DUF885 domain-containing protein [Bryobacteraceae bacterium]|nr:DUF885 domain-containing protein [Bryobacteraceae bacterium]